MNFQAPTSAASERDIYSVSRLNRLSRQLLETHFPLVWIEGELSNIARPSSGHWYFTLKDDKAQVRCAMFRSRNSRVGFRPEQGQQLLLRARVSVYEGRGDYQLIAEHMEEAGFGALQRAFEQLKQQLAAEGLFDTERKRPLPASPGRIAVVTSPTGAAIRDILSVLGRRHPGVPVTVVPTPVQGAEAAPGIVRALALANRASGADLIIVARGGGSLEDLWPFNEEVVARAIAASAIPVISAVGHEVDFTIADFAADVRAPTPSAAAELAVPDSAEQLARLRERERALADGIRRRLLGYRQTLAHLRQRLRHPGERLQNQAQRLDHLEMRLVRSVKDRLGSAGQRLNQLGLRHRQQNPAHQLTRLNDRLGALQHQLGTAIEHQLSDHRHRLGEAARLLQSVSPLQTLERGYSVLSTDSGRVVTDAGDVETGDRLRARLARGALVCEVIDRESGSGN